MSAWLVSVTILCYAGAGVAQLAKGNWAGAGVLICYAIANVFFIATLR